MNKLKELLKRLEGVIKERRSILEKDTLSDEESQKVETLSKEIDELRSSIEELKEAEERKAKLKEEQEREEKSLEELIAGTYGATDERGVTIEVHHQSLEDAMKAEYGERQTLGLYLQDVAKSEMNKRHVSAFDRIRERTGGQSVQNPETGGFLIGTTNGGTIMGESIATSVFYSRASRVSLDPGTSSITFLRPKFRSMKEGERFSGVRVGWLGEGEPIPESQIKMTKETYSTAWLKVLFRATHELLKNASALASEIRSIVPKAMAFEIDSAMWNGNGVGKMQGFMASKVKLKIPKQGSQAANTILKENIVKMYIQGLGYGAPAWFAHITCLEALLLLKFDDGSPLFVPSSQGFVGPVAGRLLGIPLVFTEHNEPLGTEGDLVLADWG